MTVWVHYEILSSYCQHKKRSTHVNNTREATWSQCCCIEHVLVSSTHWEEIIIEAGNCCCQWERGWEHFTLSISSRRFGSITEWCRRSGEYSQYCLCITESVKQQCAVNWACCFLPVALLLHENKRTYLPIDPVYPRWTLQTPGECADGVVSLYNITLDMAWMQMSHWQIAFCQQVHPEVKASGSLHSSNGGVIYKEAKTRLCQASGTDRRFISVQIGFHGQLEGTDAARRDWHPQYSLPSHCFS